ncbi:unnamed protein product [Diplocarpon coronariae]
MSPVSEKSIAPNSDDDLFCPAQHVLFWRVARERVWKRGQAEDGKIEGRKRMGPADLMPLDEGDGEGTWQQMTMWEYAEARALTITMSSSININLSIIPRLGT